MEYFMQPITKEVAKAALYILIGNRKSILRYFQEKKAKGKKVCSHLSTENRFYIYIWHKLSLEIRNWLW